MLALPPVQRKSRILWGKYRWPRSVMGNCVFVWGPQMGKYAWLPKSGQQLLGTYSSDSNGKNVYNHRTRLVENFRQNTMPITGAQEPAVANKVKNNRDLSTSSWTKRGTCSATNNQTGPDGLSNATLLEGIIDAGSGDVYEADYSTGSKFSNDAVRSVAFWIKRVSTSGTLQVQEAATTARGQWTINLANLPDRWVRLTSASTYVTVVNPFVASATGQGGLQFLKPAGAPAISFYIDLVQDQQSTYITSDIVCGSSYVTRSADAFRFTNSIFDSVKGAGSLLAVFRAQHDVADLADDVGYIALTDSGDYATDGIRAAQLMSGDGELYIESYQGGTPSSSNVNQAPVPGAYNALAFSWDANGGNCFRVLSGSAAALSLSRFPTSLDGIEIGSDASANARNGFDYALAAVFDRPLTEPEMVALTANPDRYAYTPY